MQSVCASRQEMVWWTKSNILGLLPKSGKDQWNCISEKKILQGLGMRSAGPGNEIYKQPEIYIHKQLVQ